MSAPSKPTLRFEFLQNGRVMEVAGQEARTLRALLDAGDRGVTALEVSSWALRLAHYCFKLRGYGLAIDTEREPHGGQAPGSHARYFLRSGVRLIEQQEAA